MKKTLLLCSFALFGLMANAQLVTSATTESLEAAGFSSEKIDIAAGVIFVDGEAGSIATAFADQWGMTAPCGDYKNVRVGNDEYTIENGAVGSDNPGFTSYADGFSKGAVFEIVPTKDGWLTVFTKLSPNKQYVVMEGKTGPLAYTLGYSDGTNQMHYTLPYDEDFYIDFDAPDAEKYVLDYNVKPQFPYLVAGYETAPGNGTGFFQFPVLEGVSYYFGALGSKAPCGFMVLTESNVSPEVTFLANEDKNLPEVTFEGGVVYPIDDAGVEGITVAPVKENAPVYNLMGQKVNDDYKGVVIQNGKKYIRK